MDAIIDSNGNIVTASNLYTLYTFDSLGGKLLSSTILSSSLNGGDAASADALGSHFDFNFKLRNNAGDAYKLNGQEVQFTGIVLHSKDGSGISISFKFIYNSTTAYILLGKFLYDYSSATFTGDIATPSAFCNIIYPIKNDSFNIIDTEENLHELFKELTKTASTSSLFYITSYWLLYGVSGNNGLIKTSKIFSHIAIPTLKRVTLADNLGLPKDSITSLLTNGSWANYNSEYFINIANGNTYSTIYIEADTIGGVTSISSYKLYFGSKANKKLLYVAAINTANKGSTDWMNVALKKIIFTRYDGKPTTNIDLSKEWSGFFELNKSSEENI